MMIEFAFWLPPLLLGVGIYTLLRTKRVGLKIAAALLVFVGGLFTAFEIWVLAKH